MDTIDTLLSLVEQQLLIRDSREWRSQLPFFIQLLGSLSMEDAQLLSQRVWVRYAHQGKEYSNVLFLLAHINMFVPGALAPLLPDIAARQQFYPGHLYLGAGEQTCQQLLSLLHGPVELNWNHWLQALAWIGTEEVIAQFSAWNVHPPDWRSELFIPPHDYSLEAGWELTEDGRRRDLYSSTCFELIPAEHIDPLKTEKVEKQGHCLWCQRPLQRLLDLDLRDPRCRWISAEGERLCLVVCTRCSYYVTTYLDITLAGEAHWSDLNGGMPAHLRRIKDDGEMVEFPEPLVPGIARRTPFEAVGRFLLSEKGISQLGGHPEWIDDAVYPQCPTCRQRMPCLGQVAFEDWDEGEGVFYLFLCLPCRKAATHYQQS